MRVRSVVVAALLLFSAACFVVASWMTWGVAGGLAVAGACFVVLASVYSN